MAFEAPRHMTQPTVRDAAGNVLAYPWTGAVSDAAADDTTDTYFAFGTDPDYDDSS